MDLPKLQNSDISGKRVVVRVDLDAPIQNGEVQNKYRLEAWKPTVNFLLENGASKIILMGHMGRPDGEVKEELSTKILVPVLTEILGQEVTFEGEGKIVLKENLRFNKGEEANEEEFAKEIASWGDFYVNDAFATAHRNHASIVGVPKFLPNALGLRFADEIDNLTKVLENPRKPVVVLISGIKKDKVQMIGKLEQIADKVLVGGRLPEYLGDDGLESVRLSTDKKVVVGNLNQDKEDITLNTIDRFKTEIDAAGTIVLAGVLGRYEDPGHRQGTESVFKAVANSSAFKVTGGGDSITCINMFGIADQFDWISVGGGAMIEFLTNKTLPAMEALVH